MDTTKRTTGAGIAVCRGAQPGSRVTQDGGSTTPRGSQALRPRLLPLLIALFLLQVGCVQNRAHFEEPKPADFSIAVIWKVPAGSEVWGGGGMAILEPCGTVRRASGPGCSLSTFPEPTERLDARDIHAIYGELANVDFTRSKRMPRGGDDRLWLRFDITAHGQRTRADFPFRLDEQTLGLARTKTAQEFNHREAALNVVSLLNGGFAASSNFQRVRVVAPVSKRTR